MAAPFQLAGSSWAQVKLELATDPYSNAVPAYSDVTEDLQEIEWWGGKANDFDDPQTGGMMCRLKNTGRRYEPDFLSSSLTVTASGNELLGVGRRDGRPRKDRFLQADNETAGETTLSGSMTNVQTTIPLTAWPANWPLNSAFRVMIDQETLLVNSGLGTLTPGCVRGVAQRWATAQPAAAHSSGAVVSNFFDGWMLGTVSNKAYSLGGIPSDQVSIVSDPVRSGTRAMRCKVRPGDQNDAADPTRERFEIAKTGLGELGERWWHSWSTYLPVGFHANNTTPGGVILQLGPNYGQGSPALYMRANVGTAGGGPNTLGSNYFRLAYNTGVDPSGFIGTYTTQFDLTYAQEGVWHDFMLYVDWHISAGTVKIWHRLGGGPWDLVHNNSGIPTSCDFNGLGTPSVQRRQGIYRPADATKTNYLYLDNAFAAMACTDASPDTELEESSVGIWPATSNLLANETFTAAGTAVVATDSTHQLFGNSMTRVDFLATSDYAHRTFSGLTIGQTYTATLWIEREEVDARLLTFSVRNAANSADVVAVSAKHMKGLQRVDATWTAAETTGRIRIILTDTVNKPVRAWIGAPQVELSAVPTPYIPAATTRNAARVQIPSSFLDETQGWVAMRVRLGTVSTSTGDRYLFTWQDDATHRIRLWWKDSTDSFQIERVSAGGSAKDFPTFYASGAEATVIASWDATQLHISVDGQPFISVANTSIPSLSATLLDVGSDGSANHLCGDVKWLAMGLGTVTDADAAAIFAASEFGADPLAPDFLSTMSVRHVWNASSLESRSSIDTVRFRLTLTDSAGAAQQGIYYFDDFAIEYPSGQTYSEVVFSNTCGMGLLATDRLPFFHPAEASGYEDVIDYYNPSFYYRLGEDAGTKVISRTRWRHGGKWKGETRRNRRYRTHSRVTRAEVEGVAGPAGTYKNRPTLGVPGLIVGDQDTAVRFNPSNSEYALIGPLDQSDLIDQNRLAFGAWINTGGLLGAGGYPVISGPISTVVTDNVFQMYVGSNGAIHTLNAKLQFTDSTSLTATSPSIGTGRVHVVMTWDGATLRFYTNGVLSFSDDSANGKTLRPGSVGTPSYLYIGTNNAGNFFSGTIDEVAVFEKVLEPASVLNHYTAGNDRGYNQELTGARITNILTDPLWSEAKISAGVFQMQPRFMSGQPKLDAVLEAVSSESPRSHFYFDGAGDPVFKDWDDTPAVSSGTFGETGAEVRYRDIEPIYDNEVYNEVKGSIDGGETITVSNTASKSDRRPRVRDEELSLPLANNADVTTIISTILDEWDSPILRPASIGFTATDTTRLGHALRREIGEWIRVKKLGEGGSPIDRQCVILGYRKSIGPDRVLRCSYNLSRGFDTSVTVWRLGMTGFDELGTNTVLA